MLFQAQGTFEHMLHAGLVPDVILAEALQLPGKPAIDPTITDMREGE